VLMDAAPERGEDVRPFLRIARHLAGLGLSSPAILAQDAGAGLLLLEDLGDDLFARVLEADATPEAELYSAAVDVLTILHRHAPPADAPAYDAAAMGDRAALALDWYLPGLTGLSVPDVAHRQAFARCVAGLCDAFAPQSDTLALRDYHAENLLWLPGRRDQARVGLLDFQDAALCHPAYDLVSLLQDARRDVPPDLQDAMTRRYARAMNLDPERLAAAIACLGAQRNLRILGVFARLCLRDGKPAYLRHMPRVWRYLLADLAHPALAPLAQEVERLLPEPLPSRLDRIAAQCLTTPAP